MKTFFYILITMTLLIGTTLYYVVSDNSTVIEFSPESAIVSDTLETESAMPVRNQAAQETTVAKTVQTDQGQSESRETVSQENKSEEAGRNKVLNESVSESSDASKTLSEPEKERIQNEIRTLREDTNRILKQINNNF